MTCIDSDLMLLQSIVKKNSNRFRFISLYLPYPILSYPNLLFPILTYPDQSRMTLCGTAEYMAPELMFDEENYSFEIDIFSFGMVLLEVLKRSKVGQGGFAERNPRTL